MSVRKPIDVVLVAGSGYAVRSEVAPDGSFVTPMVKRTDTYDVYIVFRGEPVDPRQEPWHTICLAYSDQLEGEFQIL